MLSPQLKDQLIFSILDRANGVASGATVTDLLVSELFEENKSLKIMLNSCLGGLTGSNQQTAMGSLGGRYQPGTPDGPSKSNNKGRK